MWQKRAGHEHDHIDGRTGQHFIHLENTVTGADHHLYIRLGVDSCAHCHRPFPKNALGQIDPKAVVAQALEMLMQNHQAIMDYSSAHGVPIHTPLVAPKVPEGYRLNKGVKAMLLPVPKRNA